MRIGIFLCSVIVFMSCQSTKTGFSDNNFQTFDRYFSTIKWTDTLDSKNTDWALGRIHEVKSPILPDNVFYATVDTANMSYKMYESRFFAEGKIDLPNGNTGYFVTRQTEDVTYDKTTLLIVFNKDLELVQDVTFSEFIGYGGFITETQSKLFKDENGVWRINSEKSESTYIAEKEEVVKKMESSNWQFLGDIFQ
jgi:hypothetical protein